MKKSLLCIILAAFIMLSSVSVMVNAQTNDEIGITGTDDNSVTPTAISTTDIVSISAGDGMSAAVRSDGTLWTWGCKDLTQSGSTWGNHWSVDAQYKGLGLAVGGNVIGSPIMSISKSTKAVVCSQQKTGTSISPASNTPMVPGVTAVLRDDNSLWAWGGGCYGVLGDGNSSSGHAVWTPTKVLDDVISFDVSGYHFGAVTSDGSLYMWGRNNSGQVGNNSTTDVLVPTKVMDGVSSVAVGGFFSAVIKTDGSLWTWGRNNYGQLGNSTTDDSYIPNKIMDGVKEVSLGETFGVALKTDGSVWTWGNNSVGQLGIGTIGSYKSVPTKVVDLEDVITIDAGIDNVAAINTINTLYMWGGNSNGKLGDGSSVSQPEPNIILRKVSKVSAGYNHTLATRTDGTIWSWGANSNGQLGDHTTEAHNKPMEFEIGELKVDFNVEDAGIKNLSVIWDDATFQEDATKYDEDFAVDGIILSEAAYSRPSVITQYGFKILANGLSNDSIDKPGYLIGYKIMYNFDEPQVEIIMAIRGTKQLLSVDAFTDIKSVNDGFDGPTNYCYERLKEARTAIAKEMGQMELSNSKKNTKYFITGHSLGGACAGKMALKMANDGVAYASNLYVYTYAAPNYTNIDKQIDSAEDLPNIYNMVNTADTVPGSPKLMGYYWIIPITLHKGGHTIELSSDKVDSFYTHVFNLFGETPWDIDWPIKAHKTATYLALIMGYNERMHTVISKNVLYRFLSVHCPVEVEVYDANNELCAFTSGDTVSYPKISPVRILIIGDEKYVELPDDSYRVRYIGTDTGSMKVEDQLVDALTGAVEHEKVFNNVVLQEGKLFVSNIHGNDDTSHTDLTIIDNEGDSTYYVDDKGNETKIAIYELNPDDVHIIVADQKYDGNEKTVSVEVDNLTEGEDYRIIYENNVEVGTASVSVKGINLYEGRVTETFQIFDSGICVNGIQWELNADGTLTIKGNGSIPDYGTEVDVAAPWRKHSERILKVVLDEGIIAIGSNSFEGCEELTELIIPTSISTIKNDAFKNCDKLNDISYSSDKTAWSEIIIEEGNSIIGEATIHYLGETRLLGDVDGDGTVTILDATYIQRKLAGIINKSEFIDDVSDADADGSLSILDATYIQRWLAGLSSNEKIGLPIS